MMQTHFNHFRSRMVRARRCRCGNRILDGRHFCAQCLGRLPEEFTEELRRASGAQDTNRRVAAYAMAENWLAAHPQPKGLA